jgi:hypothetical protein
MLTFLGANLGYVNTPLTPALAAMLKVRHPVPHSPAQGALGWGTIAFSKSLEIVTHNGGTLGQWSFIGYDPSAGVGVVILSNRAAGARLDDIGFHILNSKLPLAGTDELRPPRVRKETTVDTNVFDRYVGRYRNSHDVFVVTRADDQLFVKSGDTIVRFYPESILDYFAKSIDSQITFRTDRQGRATELIYGEEGSVKRAKRVK